MIERIMPRTENVLRKCLADKGFDVVDQTAVLRRGRVVSIGNRAQLLVHSDDVPRVGYMVVEAQI